MGRTDKQHRFRTPNYMDLGGRKKAGLRYFKLWFRTTKTGNTLPYISRTSLVIVVIV